MLTEYKSKKTGHHVQMIELLSQAKSQQAMRNKLSF
jgi:hypothetical protein